MLLPVLLAFVLPSFPDVFQFLVHIPCYMGFWWFGKSLIGPMLVGGTDAHPVFYDIREISPYAVLLSWLLVGLLFALAARRATFKFQILWAMMVIAGMTVIMNIVRQALGISLVFTGID